MSIDHVFNEVRTLNRIREELVRYVAVLSFSTDKNKDLNQSGLIARKRTLIKLFLSCWKNGIEDELIDMVKMMGYRDLVLDLLNEASNLFKFLENEDDESEDIDLMGIDRFL